MLFKAVTSIKDRERVVPGNYICEVLRLPGMLDISCLC